MALKVVHIVDNVETINYGIWNAALFSSDLLEKKYGVSSFLWVCKGGDAVRDVYANTIYLENRALSKKALDKLLCDQNLRIADTVFVTHGAWLQPTKIGCTLRKLGYKWIYVPHGMLEPWSMKQSRWKKTIYFFLVEKRLGNYANVIRAVSKNEQLNLQRHFRQPIELVENGVDVEPWRKKDCCEQVFLFLGRLHYKKGIVPLVQAWRNIMTSTNKKLLIAGPDEGELDKIVPLMDKRNMQYLGPVYGEQKKDLLTRSHYFLLPSHSEGFPTSVLEAMSFGLIPLISKGCNFETVFVKHLGYNIEPDVSSIEKCLLHIQEKKFDNDLSEANRDFVYNAYSTTVIAQKLITLYSSILN